MRGKKFLRGNNAAFLPFKTENKQMKAVRFLLLLVVAGGFVGRVSANDGVFRASGNQLVPIMETDIRVQKEVLTITRVGDHLEVNVYYEFFNPAEEKELLVGFEASAPEHSYADMRRSFPAHPFIRNFSVTVNGIPLSYGIAQVERSLFPCYLGDSVSGFIPAYMQDGKIAGLDSVVCGKIFDSIEMPRVYPKTNFDYVYHFKVLFRKGLNIIQHTYNYSLSAQQGDEYWFPYTLTAANRWANNGIDDFTLHLRMGDFESFMVRNSFFKNAQEWQFEGGGRTSEDSLYEMPVTFFHVLKGDVTFHRNNFHPEGELLVVKPEGLWSVSWAGYDATVADMMYAVGVMRCNLHPSYIEYTGIPVEQYSRLQHRIMRELPYAYRGRRFRNKKMQQFYESTQWYLPDPDYDRKSVVLTENERKWMAAW